MAHRIVGAVMSEPNLVVSLAKTRSGDRNTKGARLASADQNPAKLEMTSPRRAAPGPASSSAAPRTLRPTLEDVSTWAPRAEKACNDKRDVWPTGFVSHDRTRPGAASFVILG